MTSQMIWVTGAGGFLGTHVLPALKTAGHQVRCLTQSRPGGDAPTSDPLHREPVDFHSAADVRRVIARHGVPDVFLHMGWGAMEDPGAAEHMGANVPAARNLIDVLYEGGLKHFVFLSSVNEYGGRPGVLEESMPPEGRLTQYAEAKTAVSRYGLERAAAQGRTFLSIRLFYTFGPGQRAGALTNKLYRCFEQGQPPDLGPCEHYRDYIYVREAAEGIRRLCEVPQSAAVNLGSGHAIRVREFVTLFWRHLGGDPGDIRFGAHPMRAGEPEQPLSYASLDRLQRLTHWSPSLSVEAGIRDTIAALRRAAGSKPPQE